MSNLIEGSPFAGYWDKIGLQRASSDCVVGTLTNESVLDNPLVVKWSRRNFSAQEAHDSSLFIERSFALCKDALGPEFILSTSALMGPKKDGRHIKTKVYLVQPFIKGWTGQTLPDQLRHSSIIKEQWRVLYQRLARLYQTAAAVNRQAGAEGTFPITLTVGCSRKTALDQGNIDNLPFTPNILISSDLELKLCDFGRFTCWSNSMEPAYKQIRAMTNINQHNEGRMRA